MAETKIEWTERTWNPIVGCTIHSPGCKNCYAMRMAARLEAMAVKPDGNGNPALNHYVGTTESSRRGAVWTGNIGIAPDDSFTAPLRRKKPTDYFVNSMSDLFHKDVPFEVVDRVFAVMALTPQHTYKVLTKRSDRMREYLSDPQVNERVADAAMKLTPVGLDISAAGLFILPARFATWPRSNIWLGVSVEDQARADERIPDLLATPAAVRFISAEPLLGPVDLTDRCDGWAFNNWLTGSKRHDDPEGPNIPVHGFPKIDWVIAGGESGPDARPMHPAWARSLRDQCAAAGVAFHFKQWGEWVNEDQSPSDAVFPGTGYDPFGQGEYWAKLGKKRAGRLLDGVEHNSFPSIGEGGR